MNMIIIPAEACAALESAKYCREPKLESESKLALATRSLWQIKCIPLKDGRMAVPADVLDHEAYAAVHGQLKGYAQEEIVEADLDLPQSDAKG